MNTIFSKLVSVQLISVLVMMLVLGILLNNGVRDSAEKEFSINCNTLADSIATSLESPLVNRDIVTVQSSLDAGVKKPFVVWAFTVDSRGQVIAHTFVPRFPLELESFRTGREPRLETLILQNGRTVRVVRVPVLAGIPGYLVLGVSQDGLELYLQTVGSRLLITLSALLACFCVLFVAFARKITRPITSLAEDIQRVHQDPKAEIADESRGSSDEIGQLRSAFVQMAREVKAQQLRLEDGINLRTSQLESALLKANNTSTELAQSEGRIRAMVDSCMDAVVTFDIDGRVTSWNPTAVEMFQHTSEQAKGRSLESLILPRSTAVNPETGLLSHLSQCQGGETARSIVLEANRRDGSSLSVELVITMFCDVHGTSLCAFIRDVTARLTNEKELIRARDAAEEGSKAKGEFLATMSHEIRTPMNGVIGFVQLLEDTPLSQDQRELTSTVKASAQALLTIINDVLDFSKIESRRLELESIPLQLDRIGSDVVDLINAQAEAKDISLVLNCSPDLPAHVLGDPGRMRQIMLNLLGNAVKFTESGHVVLKLDWTAKTDKAGSGWFEVNVEDTGVGIPIDRIDRLFHQFSQADSSTTRRFGGTGLGLAISKRLVEQMGGTIWVVSEVGKGTTFSYRIPLPCPEVGSAPEARTELLRGRRILIQDPVLVNREALQRWLTAQGVASQGVASSDEALAALTEASKGANPFDIAVLDHSTNGGHSCINPLWLKRNAATRRLLLTAVVQSRQRSESRKLIERGYDLVLTRPLAKSHALQQWAESCESILQETSFSLRRSTLIDPANSASPLLSATDVRGLTGSPISVAADSFNGIRVLVVDDNLTNRKLAARMLEKLNIVVTLANNGKEAVEYIQKETFDLVLMDCQMPELNGYEATGEIRTLEKTGRIPLSSRRPHAFLPVIALTANALEGDRIKCLEAGMNDYLTKPIDAAALRSLLQNWTKPPLKAA